MKDFFAKSKYAYLIIAFFIPATIMWLIYIAMEVYPFGNNSVLVLDLNAQYVYFFEALRDFFNGTASLLYSWRRALGGEFMGIFAYYLASPLSIIVALFPKKMITEALLCMFLIKTGLCGFTAGFYLEKTRPTKRINVILFSTLYALSSYAIVMQHNTMWTDALIMLPLVMLGIESLIKEGKFKLFTISLSVTILANYYIGYMVCIFVFFYFFYYYITYSADDCALSHETHHFLKSFARIGAFSVIAVSIAMIIIYPAYYSLSFGKSTFSNPDFSFAQKFDFLDFLSKFYPGSYDTVRPAGLPFVYCGLLTVIFLPIFFITNKIRPREKIMGGLILTFFILSFNSTTIDLVWHGFQKPNWLNYRYSFIFIFLLIVFAYRAFEYLDVTDYRFVLGSSGVLVLLLLIIQKQDYSYIDDLRCVWISLAFIGIYTVTLYFVKNNKLGNSSALILAIVVVTEMFSSGLLNITALDKDVTYSSRVSYRTFIDKYQPTVDYIKKLDSSFYRMEKNKHRKTNDSMTLGMNGVTNSTSTLNKSVVDLLHSLGYSAKSHWSKYQGGTPVADSLLGIKYFIFDNTENYGLYEQIYEDTENKLYAFSNPYALSVAYAASSDIEDLDISETTSPFEVMNSIVTALMGSDERIEVFKPISIDTTTPNNMRTDILSQHKKYTKEDTNSAASLNYKITPPCDARIYYYFPSKWAREVNLTVNGSIKGSFFGGDSFNVMYMGEYTGGEELTISLVPTGDEIYISSEDYFFYYLDTDVFEEVFDTLSKGNFEISEYTDTKLSGKITVTDDKTTLFTTIPYDEGWHVYVDGTEIPLIKTLDSLLAVVVSAGEHDVRFEYMPKCFTVGATLSVCGLFAFLLICVLDFIISRKRKTSCPDPNWIIDDSEIIGNQSCENDAESEIRAPEESEPSEVSNANKNSENSDEPDEKSSDSFDDDEEN